MTYPVHPFAMSELHKVFDPDRHFTIIELHDQEIGNFFVVQERRTTDHEAPKL